MLNRFNNREGIFAWKSETAAHPEFGDNDYGAAPSSPNYGTHVDGPQINERGGIRFVQGIGTQYATGEARDRAETDITIPTRLTNAGLVTQCTQSSGGALTRTAIWTGVSNRNSTGQQRIHRHCKCARYVMSIRQGQDVMFTPTFFALGKPDVLANGAGLAPTYSDLIAAGNPRSFVHVTSIQFGNSGNLEARPYVTGLDFTVDNGLVRENVEVDKGENVVTSRRALQLVEGPVTVQGNLILDARLSAAALAAASDPANWTNIGTVPIVIDGITLTLTGFRWNGEDQQGGPSGSPLTYTVPFIAVAAAIS